MKNYYRILNVKENASDKEIKNAYKALVLKYHPDKNNGKKNEIYQLIVDAYYTLKDPYTRGKYDQKLEDYKNFNFGNKLFRDPFENLKDPFYDFRNIFNKDFFGNSIKSNNSLSNIIDSQINESFDNNFENMFDKAFNMFNNLDIREENKNNNNYYTSESFFSSKIDMNGDKVVKKSFYKNLNGKEDNYKHEYIEKKDGSIINQKESGNKNLFKNNYKKIKN